jgi:TetR/AcrR family transcriptional repressor of nem operon
LILKINNHFRAQNLLKNVKIEKIFGKLDDWSYICTEYIEIMHKTLKHEAKADYLLDKGMDVLWCKGYNGTSVNDIVKAAGVPKGSFYFYFDSKEDFAVKALNMYFETMFNPAREILEDSSLSAKERLVKFYEYRHEQIVDKMQCKLGCLGSNIGSEMSEHSEKIRNTILDMETLMKSKISAVFKEAQENGEINTAFDSLNIVDFLEDASKGAMITMKEKQSSAPQDNLLNFIKTLFLN